MSLAAHAHRVRTGRSGKPERGTLTKPLPMLTEPISGLADSLGSNCPVHEAAPGEPCWTLDTSHGFQPAVCGARVARAQEHLPGRPRRAFYNPYRERAGGDE